MPRCLRQPQGTGPLRCGRLPGSGGQVRTSSPEVFSKRQIPAPHRAGPTVGSGLPFGAPPFRELPEGAAVRRHWRFLVPLAAVLASLLALTLSPVATFAAPGVLPYVHGTSTEPVYSYQNAIRESVWVQTPNDSDKDGKPDRVRVDIVRPREAASTGVKVPVILEASPYYSCCGRGNESQLKGYAADGTVNAMPLYYDNYFVPRGYAFAAVDLSGTNKSQGCPDVGGPAEVGSAKAVVDWLNGRALGFNADGSPAKATWTTGKTGMIGKSWDGSIANGVAATGVPGLETIVPISSISSWYDYQRFGGGCCALPAMSRTWAAWSTAVRRASVSRRSTPRRRPATTVRATTTRIGRPGTTGRPSTRCTRASSSSTASTT
ncbi:CocE/NonD family hydrolase [Fodinicola feengrottensis]|uniref:CocE/NonD family hydrolase n=1 Tax=Fodinicola feengrottensis TaxID=435914 RepID=UPI0013D19B2A|nr:CocE/NonD family hydrolase [Fodinicola feengrottensis]